VSERIRVRSIIGRFLEHSRVYYFENQGKPLVYVGSADWMPRNLHNRVEVVFPIEDPSLKNHLINDILLRFLEDNTRSWRLLPDASYERIVAAGDAEPRSAQAEFMEAALHPNRKRSARGTPRARMISSTSAKSTGKAAVGPAVEPKKRAKEASPKR
jgi:polyphosphate kinase